MYSDWSVGNVVSACKKLIFRSGKFYNEIIANFAIQCLKEKKCGMKYERLIKDPHYKYDHYSSSSSSSAAVVVVVV